MNYRVHLKDECPTTSVVAKRTVSYFLHFVWTKVHQNDSTGGIVLSIHVLSKGKPFLACD